MAADQFVFFVSGLIGFGPSVAVLFHALRTYDYPHTEKAYFDTGRVFLALAVGMVLGTASGALTVALQQGILSLVALVIVLLQDGHGRPSAAGVASFARSAPHRGHRASALLTNAPHEGQR